METYNTLVLGKITAKRVTPSTRPKTARLYACDTIFEGGMMLQNVTIYYTETKRGRKFFILFSRL
jgi:hypothetical protein